jgi:drug/metabolite transporter (DMT)-like permease
MNLYFLIFAAAASYITGDFLAKTWSVKNDWKYLAISLSFYVLGGLLYALLIKKSSLSIALTATPLFTIIIGLAFAYFYFGEKLNSTQYLGMALGFVALVLLLSPVEIFSK